jgi:hypothetical protein
MLAISPFSYYTSPSTMPLPHSSSVSQLSVHSVLVVVTFVFDRQFALDDTTQRGLDGTLTVHIQWKAQNVSSPLSTELQSMA